MGRMRGFRIQKCASFVFVGYTKSMGASQTKTAQSLGDRTPLTKEQLQSFAAGAALFNAGRFYEAHEDWEKGWNRLPLPDRPQVQAAILVSAVFVLIEKKRWDPAKRLARLAMERFAEAATAAQIHEVEPALLLPGVEERLMRVLARLEVGDFDSLSVEGLSSGLTARLRSELDHELRRESVKE
jgi:hypothetical protein